MYRSKRYSHSLSFSQRCVCMCGQDFTEGSNAGFDPALWKDQFNAVRALVFQSTNSDRQILGEGRKDQKSLFTFWHILNSLVSYPSPCLSPEVHQFYFPAKNNTAQPRALNYFCMLQPHTPVSFWTVATDQTGRQGRAGIKHGLSSK